MIRVGIVGLGKIGEDHLNRIQNRISGMEVTGLFDVVENRCEDLIEKYHLNAKNFDSYQDLVESDQVDLVVVTAINQLHAEVAIAALNANKYVFVEKPLAMTQEECLEVMKAEEKTGKRMLQVGFMRRYDPGYQTLKQYIEKGEIGKPLMAHCRHFNTYLSQPKNYVSSQAIVETFIHEIEIMHWLLDEEYKSAKVYFPKRAAVTNEYNTPLQDPQVVVLETESGVNIVTEVFVNAYGYDIHCDIVGELGMAQLPAVPSVVLSKAARRSTSILTDWKERFIAAYDVEFQDIADRLNASEELNGPSSWDGYVSAVTSDACILSQQTGQTEKIELITKPDFYKQFN
ncbi:MULTISPECIES: Gfo/Idh/MocA family protein [unclassified Gemella]|uniref:Gfo/Idh/MocA family protein n=1 Tax=unclassified Gemella TaxID=2624949 RepID=UPI001C04DE0F|nr:MULTISPECIES: Gfo/Idh/MocA family oxidoreductase [unclassified Gemella]MBU0278245.1 Gfo/Idh/MocA family oxidoreductase [Gemella sp. zg-1178]QWQ38800.1 Gfo/Idh/MocA family oxidoreductase [Gemella sp. zg-570]